MHRAQPFRFALILLMAAAFLLTRVGGVHLHLCFDGDEPPASVHLEDAGLHHGEAGASASHHDLDIAASGDLLNKLKLDLPALLFAILLLGLFTLSARRAPFGRQTAVVLPFVHFLRPPLRGPPQPYSV